MKFLPFNLNTMPHGPPYLSFLPFQDARRVDVSGRPCLPVGAAPTAGVHSVPGSAVNSGYSTGSSSPYLKFPKGLLLRWCLQIVGTCGQFYSPEVLVAFRMKGYYMNLKVCHSSPNRHQLYYLVPRFRVRYSYTLWAR